MTGTGNFLLACLSVAMVLGDTATARCHGPEGQIVVIGTAWVAHDGCNVCACTQFEVDCQTWKNCNGESEGSSDDHLGNPGDPICSYAGYDHYTVGQTWVTKDGCNHCVCNSWGMNCTADPCGNTGFAQPRPEGSQVEFMDCPYKNQVYKYRDHFMADDGCNTCYCIMPGNYASFPACTSTPCDFVG